MKNKSIIIINLIGMFFIIIGYIASYLSYSIHIKRINELEKQLDIVVVENNKLKIENEHLWNNYYEDVSDYNGEYEYYE